MSIFFLCSFYIVGTYRRYIHWPKQVVRSLFAQLYMVVCLVPSVVVVVVAALVFSVLLCHIRAYFPSHDQIHQDTDSSSNIGLCCEMSLLNVFSPRHSQMNITIRFVMIE